MGHETISISMLRENNLIVGRKTYLETHTSLMFSLQSKQENKWIGSYMQMDPSDVGSIILV